MLRVGAATMRVARQLPRSSRVSLSDMLMMFLQRRLALGSRTGLLLPDTYLIIA